MPRTKPTWIAFNQGELDQATLARIDLDTYERGCEIMENVIPLVQGGMAKAPGTIHIQSTENNSDGFLYPFVFSEEETFGLELTANSMRMIAPEGLVVLQGAAATIGTFDGSQSGPQSPGGSTPPSGGSSGTGSGTSTVQPGDFGGGFGDFNIGFL